MARQVQATYATLVLVVGNYVDKLPLDISADGLDDNGRFLAPGQLARWGEPP